MCLPADRTPTPACRLLDCSRLFATFATAMKQSIRYILWGSLLLLLASCARQPAEVRFQELLNRQCRESESVAADIVDRLTSAPIDSLYSLSAATKGAYFIVFDSVGPCYWSNNWISISQIRTNELDRWFYQRADNAKPDPIRFCP